MDAAGVSQAVLLGWYWENHSTCVRQNAFYEKCIRAHPDRLAAFATVHPAAGGQALAELRRAREAGFIGLGELSPHSQHLPLTDPWWIKLVVLAGDLNLPVNLHVTDPDSGGYPGRIETPLAELVRLAEEFPRTKFILAHWGGGLALGSACGALGNVYYDTAASPLLYGADIWNRAMAASQGDRVLFGSDYPLVLYPRTEAAPGFGTLLAEVRTAGMGAGKTAAVLADNAVRLFGW